MPSMAQAASVIKPIVACREEADSKKVLEFLGKNDKAGLDKSFDLHDEVYRKIFTRCGLKFVAVEADSGAMGGSQSQEFMVRTPAGEDLVVSCEKCNYAANMEKATSKLAAIEDLKPESDGKPLLIHTPGKGAIADVAEFLGISAQQDIKTVAYMAQKPGDDGKTTEQPVIAFLRGDHTVNETKLLTLVKAANLRPMQAEELEKYFQGPGGFIGPIGLIGPLSSTERCRRCRTCFRLRSALIRMRMRPRASSVLANAPASFNRFHRVRSDTIG